MHTTRLVKTLRYLSMLDANLSTICTIAPLAFHVAGGNKVPKK